MMAVVSTNSIQTRHQYYAFGMEQRHCLQTPRHFMERLNPCTTLRVNTITVQLCVRCEGGALNKDVIIKEIGSLDLHVISLGPVSNLTKAMAKTTI